MESFFVNISLYVSASCCFFIYWELHRYSWKLNHITLHPIISEEILNLLKCLIRIHTMLWHISEKNSQGNYFTYSNLATTNNLNINVFMFLTNRENQIIVFHLVSNALMPLFYSIIISSLAFLNFIEFHFPK